MSALDLVGRWPVVIHDLVVVEDPRSEERTRTQVFSHGEPWTFDRLLAPKPWEAEPGQR